MFFKLTEERFADLLSEFASPVMLRERLLETERRNLRYYGYGIKGFTLSMIETAIQITEGKVPVGVIRQLLSAGREMSRHPIELLPGVAEAIEELRHRYTLIVITKGDLLEQERKLAQSGLGDLVDGIEIVSDKTSKVYVNAFREYGDGPTRAVMVGNSVKSDIIPALQAGSWAIYIQHDLTWELEHAALPIDAHRLRQIGEMAELPRLIESID